MDHPWYAQSTGYSLLRVLLLPLRVLIALAGMVALFPLLMMLPGITAPFDAESILVAGAAIALHGLGFAAFCWDHHASVDALAKRQLRRANRRALRQLA